MGRMLEALKSTESQQDRPTAPVLSLRPFPIDQEDEAEDPAIPFIEVGGPRPAGQTAIFKPAPAPASQTADVQPQADGTGARPISVVYRPLPIAPRPLPPAGERFAPDLVAFHQPHHMASCQYRAVWSSMAAQLPATKAQVLLFTAPAPDIGTTTVLLNLAISVAKENQQRVVVVDANWSRQAIAGCLGLPSSPGLCDVLAQRVTLPQVLHPTGLPNLDALTAGTCSGETRLAGEPMWAVLRQLREQFDLVLVDAPCWDGRPEIIALGSACDAVYLVLRQGEAQMQEPDGTADGMVRQGCPLRGCILTLR